METKPIPIRLNLEEIGRIDRAAEMMGVPRSTIMRLGIFNQLPEIEAGHIKLRRRELD
jgi:predicted DNA-binding protein